MQICNEDIWIQTSFCLVNFLEAINVGKVLSNPLYLDEQDQKKWQRHACSLDLYYYYWQPLNANHMIIRRTPTVQLKNWY